MLICLRLLLLAAWVLSSSLSDLKNVLVKGQIGPSELYMWSWDISWTKCVCARHICTHIICICLHDELVSFGKTVLLNIAPPAQIGKVHCALSQWGSDWCEKQHSSYRASIVPHHVNTTIFLQSAPFSRSNAFPACLSGLHKHEILMTSKSGLMTWTPCGNFCAKVTL